MLSISEEKELEYTILLEKAVKKLVDLGVAATPKEAVEILAAPSFQKKFYESFPI